MPHHEVVRHIFVSVAGRCSLLGGQVVHVTHCSSGQWVHVTLLEWSSCPVVKLSTWHTARVVKLSSGQVVHVTLLNSALSTHVILASCWQFLSTSCRWTCALAVHTNHLSSTDVISGGGPDPHFLEWGTDPPIYTYTSSLVPLFRPKLRHCCQVSNVCGKAQRVARPALTRLQNSAVVDQSF